MKLSIIIPCYNSEKFISKTLDMLLSQGLQDSEVIIVNDGSKDDTAEIVREYEKINPAIHLINKQNEGVSVARNTGLKAASGKFIYFLDSDDSLTDGALDFFRETISSHPNNIFFAFGYYTEYYGKMIKDFAVRNYNEIILDSLVLKQNFLLKKLCFHICSCIFEKKFLQNHNIYFTPGLRIGEDVEFLLKVLQYAPDCVYKSRHCYIYKIRDDSTMQGYKFSKFTMDNLKSYEIRRNKMFESDFQTKELNSYSNFWFATQYISHLRMYLKSNSKEERINKIFIYDKKKLFFPIKTRLNYFSFIILVFRIIPIKILLKVFK